MIRGEGNACLSFTLNALIYSVLWSVVKGEGKKF